VEGEAISGFRHNDHIILCVFQLGSAQIRFVDECASIKGEVAYGQIDAICFQYLADIIGANLLI
jgi:hypothetical protein